jgi:hypothetical protein
MILDVALLPLKSSITPTMADAKYNVRASSKRMVAISETPQFTVLDLYMKPVGSLSHFFIGDVQIFSDLSCERTTYP